jgi:tape measure domain-containing protein
MPATLDGLIVPIKIDLSGLTSGATAAKSNIADVATAAQNATATFSKMNGSANMAKVVTGTDVAQAQLTLLESKVNEARLKLETLQNSADAGQAISGIPEAEAQLTLLEAKAQQARSDLNSLASTSSATGEALDSSFSQASSAVSAFEEQASATNASFLGSIGSMGAGITEFIGKLGLVGMGYQTVKGVAQGLFDTLLSGNASMEQTRTAFVQLLGSSKAADDELQKLSAFAASTPFEFPELADSTQKLLAFQIPLKDTQPLLTAIGDSLSGLGKNTAASLDQVVSVFGQMNAAGKIQTQDLMQLTSVGINGFQILSNVMGKPVATIKDMVSGGLIPAKDGIEALRKGMEQTFGGGMQAQSETFNGLLSTLQDNVNGALRAFTGPLFDAAKQGLTVLGNLVSSKAFQDFAKGTGQQIAKVFGDIGSALANIQGVGSHILTFFNEVSQGWKNIFVDADNNSSLPGIISSLEKLGASAKKFGDTIGPYILPTLSELNSILTVTAGWMTSLVAPALDSLSGRFNALTAFLKPIIDKLIPLGIAFENLINNVMPIVVGFMDWITQSNILTPIMGTLGTAVGGVVTVVTNLVTWVSQLAYFFTNNQVAGDLLVGTLGGLTVAFAAVKITSFVSSVADFIAMIPTMIGLITFWAAGQWTVAAAAIATAAPYILIGVVVALVIAGIILAIQHWGEIVTWLQGVWGAVSSFFQGVFAKIGSVFSGIGTWFHDRFTEAWNGVTSAWDKVTQFFSGIWDKITGTFSNIGNWFHDRFQQAGDGAQNGWQKTQSFFGGIGKWFQDRGNDAVKGFQAGLKGIEDVGKWIYDHNRYVRAAVADIQKIFTDISDGITKAWSATATWLSTTWTKLVQIVETSWSNTYNTISGWINKTIAFITKIWNDEVTYWTSVWNLISQTVTIYWTLIYTAISTWITKVVTWITDKWTIITGWLQTQWDKISGFAEAAWNKIYTTVSGWISKIGDWITTQWTIATNWLQAQWDKVAGFADKMWQSVSGVFGGIWNKYLSGPLGGLWKNITDWWGGIVSKASQLGSDFMNGIASGVSNATHAIGNAIHNVLANTIWGLGWNDIPGYTSSSGPILAHANGILNNPFGHTALVGEKGPELMFIPQGASIFPNGSFAMNDTASYPIQPSTAMVTSAATTASIQAGTNNGGQTFIFETDGVQQTRMINTNTARQVRLKLGPRGRY